MAAAHQHLVNNFPHTISQLGLEITQELIQKFSGDFTRLVQIAPNSMIAPREFVDSAVKCYTFKPRADDIFIMGFPCSGMMDLTWMLLHLFKLNILEPTELPIILAPLLESEGFITAGIMAHAGITSAGTMTLHSISAAMRVLGEMEGKRLIRTHLPFSMLDPDILNTGCKVIYMVRSPRDVIVSMYEVHRKRRQFNRDLEDYVDLFMNNLLMYTPYWAHVKQAHDFVGHPNFKLVCYDAMKQDWNRTFGEVLEFLNYSRTPETNERIDSMFNLYHGVLDHFQRDYCDVGLDDDFAGEREKGDQLSPALRGKIAHWMATNRREVGIDVPYFA